MEIRISTKQILNILYVISWMIFLGICVEAGSYIFNACYTFYFNSGKGAYLNLASLYDFDPGYYLVMLLLMLIPTTLQAIMFYLIVKILQDNKLDMAKPFNETTVRFVFLISYLSFGIGLFSSWGVKYQEWFIEQGVTMPSTEQLSLGGSDVWIFMGVILIVIAHIFKRGIEIQSENELTV